MESGSKRFIYGEVFIPFLHGIVLVYDHLRCGFNGHVPVRRLPICRPTALNEGGFDHSLADVCNTLFA